MSSIAFGPVSGTWNTDLLWIGGSKPTAGDTAVFNALSANVTIDTNGGVCRALDCTAYTGTMTHNASSTLTIGDGTAGAFTLVSGMTYTAAADTAALAFISTTTGNTLTTAGKLLGNVTFNGVGGGWTLQDALTTRAVTTTITLTAGTLNTNGKAVSTGLFASSNTNTRVLTLGASIITLTGVGTVWSMATVTNLTLSAASSTLIIYDSSSSSKTFAGGGKTFGAFETTGGGTGAIILTGANTFSSFDIGEPKTVTFPAGVTTVMTSLIANGDLGDVITLASSSGGSAATISIASGTVTVDHCSIQDLTVTGGATFVANNSTNVSGNTGWTFATLKEIRNLRRTHLMRLG